jgi:TonB family protein
MLFAINPYRFRVFAFFPNIYCKPRLWKSDYFLLSLIMAKKCFYLFILFFTSQIVAQVSGVKAELEGQVVGGKEELDQVIQTQLTLPKTLLTSNFDVNTTVFFDLDSVGNAVNINARGVQNNALRNEIARMFKFLKFKRTQSAFYIPDPYYLTFHFSTDKYNRYMKQRARLNLKKGVLADSSLIVYSKADRSPEYFKNGDEGLAEFVLSEIEYPKLAVEKSIEGTVNLEFVVETNGYVTGITVKHGVTTGCTEEAIRLVKLTKWQPAMVNNKYVRYRTNYPITFSLRNVSRDISSSSTIGQ